MDADLKIRGCRREFIGGNSKKRDFFEGKVEEDRGGI